MEAPEPELLRAKIEVSPKCSEDLEATRLVEDSMSKSEPGRLASNGRTSVMSEYRLV
jgi:hypothetical protein